MHIQKTQKINNWKVKIIKSFYGTDDHWENYVDYSYERKGQDVRYCLDDHKIRNLGWKNRTKFNDGLFKTIKFYID